MTAETTIKQAEALVINTETNYIKGLVSESEKASREGREYEAGLILNDVIKEGKRVHKKPLEEYDEEEIIIANLIKKK